MKALPMILAAKGSVLLLVALSEGGGFSWGEVLGSLDMSISPGGVA
jgi:hypothetical protein